MPSTSLEQTRPQQRPLVLVSGASSNHFLSLCSFWAHAWPVCTPQNSPWVRCVCYDLGLSEVELEFVRRQWPGIDWRTFEFDQYPAHVRIGLNELDRAGYYAWKPILLEQLARELEKPR